MILLLDTHIALWAITGDAALGEKFLDRLRHDPDIFLSPVSLWRDARSTLIHRSGELLTRISIRALSSGWGRPRA